MEKEDKSKSSKKQAKFRSKWLEDPFTKFFVKRVPQLNEKQEVVVDEKGNITYDHYHYHCTLCNDILRCDHFERHRNSTISHIKLTPQDLRTTEQQKTLESLLDKKQSKAKDETKKQISIDKTFSKTETKDNKLLEGKLRILIFCIDHNLPFTFVEDLFKLLNDLKKENQLLPMGGTKMTRETASNLAKNCIYPYLKIKVIQRMRESKYSIAFDEATGICGKKFFLVMIRFLNTETLLYESFVHSLFEVENSKGINLYSLLKNEVLNEDKILTNLMGVCSDGASNLRSKGEDSLTSILSTNYNYIAYQKKNVRTKKKKFN